MSVKTYVTFGQVHSHVINGVVFDKDSIAVLETESHEAARVRAFELFGNQFFTTYPEQTFDPDSLLLFPRGLIAVE